MEKIDLPVGKKVKGYGIRNEFGEFQFIPAQVGSRPDGMKVVKETAEYVIYECKNKVKVVLNISKEKNDVSYPVGLFKLLNNIIADLRNYDF